ncbi:MAG: hypothetical protein IPH07_36915 [Deltaproteobacteria bacterium]|nr:hypothetical protein [Deltaproteobacteria bacterium]MBK8713406.1 hypothetical protein [Deltaproteobacteria bacterium]MBP7288031.1 hypothetical protein [Nannocystaceae bacterium]
MITERWPVRCELVGLLVAGVSMLGCDRISATSEATPSPQTEAIGSMPSNAAAANTSNETAAKPGTAVAPTPSDGERMLAELTPDTVVGPAGVWTTSEDPEDPYVRRDDRDAQLAFAVHSFAPDGVEHRVVVASIATRSTRTSAS